MSITYQKLGDVLTIERGGSPRPIKKYLTDDQDGLNWIKIGDATASNKYIYETKEKITKDGLHKTRFVNVGDFILSNSMSFGRPYIMKTTGCIHDGWLVLKGIDEANIDRDFLYYILCSPDIFKQFDNLAAGSTVRNLNIGLVSSVKIPIPKMEQQKKTVEILDKTFEAIDKAAENIEKNIENTKEFFQSRLNELFSQEGEDYKVKTLNDVCNKIFAGGDVPKDNFSKEKTAEYEIPVFANGIKDKGLYGFTNIQKVESPSITVSARGTIGYSEIRKGPFYPIVRLIVLIPNYEIIDIEFLQYTIKRIDFKNTGTSIPQLTVPMVKKYEIPFMPIDDQKKIVKELNMFSKEINQLEKYYCQKLDNLEELKKSILHKAFKGELVV